MHSEPRPQTGRTDADELDLRAEVRGRANAILAELQAELPEWETVSELALGAHQRIEAGL